jgi:hypothetical protein
VARIEIARTCMPGSTSPERPFQARARGVLRDLGGGAVDSCDLDGKLKRPSRH